MPLSLLRLLLLVLLLVLLAVGMLEARAVPQRYLLSARRRCDEKRQRLSSAVSVRRIKGCFEGSSEGGPI